MSLQSILLPPDEEGRQYTSHIARCDVCGYTRRVATHLVGSVSAGWIRGEAREIGWHSNSSQGIRSDKDFCPRHVLSEKGALTKVQTLETQYLVGETFHVSVTGAGRVRATVRRGKKMPEREAFRILESTKRDQWQRHNDDLVAAVFDLGEDVIYYERPLSEYGLFRTKRRGRQIQPAMREFHKWVVARWPHVEVKYDHDPEHWDRPAVVFSRLYARDLPELCRRTRIPKGRANVDQREIGLEMIRASFSLEDLEKMVTSGP